MKLVIDIPEDVIESAKSNPNYYPTYHFEKIWRAIVNGTPLDDLRAEIKQLPYQRIFGNVSSYSLLDTVIEIIDKYREEQEE